MSKITVYTDGGSRGNPGPAGIGVYAVDNDGQELIRHKESIGNSTNNMAEYLAVAKALELLRKKYGKKATDLAVELKMDSELVKKQLNGEYQIKDPGLVPVYMDIHNMRVASFPNLTYTHIPRDLNQQADKLVNEALDEV